MKRTSILWVLCPVLLSACGSSGDALFGSVAPSCDPPQVACGSACVDPNTDPQHCGGCGQPCSESEKCSAGVCRSSSCAAQEKLCADTCVDPQTNSSHCGECGHACTTGQACVAGQCKGGLSCADGRTLCGNTCTDLKTDPLHCGDCSHACTTGQVCNEGACKEGGDCTKTPCTGLSFCNTTTGQCVPGCSQQSQCGPQEHCDLSSHTCACETGFHRCGSCVSNSSVESCGSSSCTPCAAPAHGTASCVDQSCTFGCTTGYHRCGDSCASDSSISSCGDSCTPCQATLHGSATCVAGTCGLACDSGFHLCKGQCVPNDSIETCGSSCTPCPAPTNSIATCEKGVCGVVCQSGYHDCGGSCLSNTSVLSCGASCSPCPAPAQATALCLNGTCDFSCASGHHRCGNQCLSDSSPNSCGDACSPCVAPNHASALCVAGECGFACLSGYHACGAECFADSDPTHCGSACQSCPTPPGATPSCENGACGFTCAAGFISCGGTCIACSDPHGTASCSNGACVLTCSSGYHSCGGVCVDSTSPEHCGSLCTSCPSVPNGQTTCTQGLCGITCNNGYRSCEAVCAACPDPAGVESFTCAGASCVVAACQVGYYACGSACCQLPTEVIQLGDITGEPSAALDSTGRVHVAYYEKGSNAGLRYAVRTATNTWQVQSVPNASAGSLALDSSDQPRIAFNSSWSVKLATWTGSAWNSETVYSSSWGYGPEVGTQGLTIDSTGGPHVAIGQTSGGPNQSNIMHHYRSATGWTYQTLGSESSAISSPTIVGANNLLHVTWISYTPKALRYRYYDGSAWQSATPSTQAYCCADAYVTLGPAGAPFIGFEHTSGGYGLVYKPASTWLSQTLLAQITTPYNLAVSSTSDVHFLYANTAGTTQVLYYAKPAGGSWDTYSIAKGGAGRILIDSANQPHIVYADGTGIYYVRP